MKFQYFGHLMQRADSLANTLMLGKIEGRRRRLDELVGRHQWFNGHEFEQILGESEGQGSLACCSPRVCKDSEWLNKNLLIVASLVAQMVKNLPAMQETQVPLLGLEDPLEKGMTTCSCILAQSALVLLPENSMDRGTSQATVRGVAVKHDWATLSLFNLLIHFTNKNSMASLSVIKHSNFPLYGWNAICILFHSTCILFHIPTHMPASWNQNVSYSCLLWIFIYVDYSTLNIQFPTSSNVFSPILADSTRIIPSHLFRLSRDVILSGKSFLKSFRTNLLLGTPSHCIINLWSNKISKALHIANVQ